MNAELELYHFTESLMAGSQPYAGKSLNDRTAGKFYTPSEIGDRLVEDVSTLIDFGGQDELSIIDPFCGDGRLVSNFLKKNADLLKGKTCLIHLWDVDAKAVAEAACHLERLTSSLGLKKSIFAVCQNSFSEDHIRFGRFDLCITNPPWEVIKPDKRELADLSDLETDEYLIRLRKLDDFISRKYPLSQPKIKFSGWGTNLARVGVEFALRLVEPINGIAGIVSPASLFGDKMSFKLREWMFSKFDLKKVNHYRAESKLFEKVDQDVVSFSCKSAEISSVELGMTKFTYFDKLRIEQDFGEFPFNSSELKEVDYCLPNYFGLKGMDIINLLGQFSRLGDLNELWTGRELDGTRDKDLMHPVGEIPLYKGRMINRYRIIGEPDSFVRKNDVNRLPASFCHKRIGWRDVSRHSQKRRMKACILAENVITDNSLNIACVKNSEDDELLFAILVVMNSLIFELQVRCYLSTSHLSLGTVRMAKIPDLNDRNVVNHLAKFGKALTNGVTVNELSAERAVCEAYGLNHSVVDRIQGIFGNDDK